MRPRILLLGGTGEARELAAMLVAAGWDVTTSLAGVTEEPVWPQGAVVSGGFGGEEGLRRFLAERRFEAVADATHPFAVRISRHAAAAAAELRLRYLRLERPPWRMSEGDRWIEAADATAAAKALARDARALLTIGRRGIAPFLNRPDIGGVARMIEAPPHKLPENWTLLQARPPFSLADELRLLEAESITHVVAKNSGGEATRAKLEAARERKIPVVMIERPDKPEARTAASAEELARLLMA